MRTQVDYVNVPATGTVSAIFAAKNASRITIWTPLVESANLFLGIGFDATSGSMARAQDAVNIGSGDWAWAVDSATGVRAVDVTAIIGGAPHGRVELSAAQTDIRTFAVVTKYE